MPGAGAGGNEVGRISIRVVPDLDRFYEELRAGVEEAEKAVRGKIHFDPELDGLREKVKAETEGLEAKVKIRADTDLFQKRMLADLAAAHRDFEVQIPISVEGEDTRRRVAAGVKEATALIRADIPLDLELATGQREKILAEVAEFKRLAEAEPIKLKLDPQFDYSFRQRMQALADDRVSAERKANAEILKNQEIFRSAQLKAAEERAKAALEPSGFEKALAEAKAGAGAAGVKLDVDFKDKEAEAHLAELVAKLKAEAALARIKIDVDVERHSATGGVTSLLGDAASGIGGGLSVLKDQTALIAVAVVALLAPALALLTGALVALPALIAGVALPLGVLALGFKGIEDAAEASGLLSEGKKGKVGIGPQLKALQETLSKKFEDGFTPIFQKIAPLLPAVGTALLPIADRLVGMAKGLTDVVTSSSGMAAFQTTIDNISKAMEVVTPGIAKFSEGLLNLIAGGSRSLPGFAGLFDDMATALGNWVTRISTVGPDGTSQLDRALGNLKDTLKGLGEIIGEFGSQGLDFLSDPEFAKSMKTFVADAKTFVHDVLPEFRDGFKDIADFFHGIVTAMDKLSSFKPPSWLPQGNKGSVTDDGGNEIGSRNLVTGKVGDLFPGFTDGGKQFQDVAGGAVPSTLILQQLPGLFQTAKAATSDFFTTLANIPTEVGNAFGSLQSEAQKAMDGFASAISSGVDKAVSFFQGLAGKIVAALGNLAGQLESAGRNAAEGLVRGLTSVDIPSIGAGIGKGFEGGLKNHLGIRSPSTVMHGHGVSIMEGLQNGLDGGLQGVLERAKSIAQQISDAISNGAKITPQQLTQLKQSMSELGLEHDQLKVKLDQTTDKGERKGLQDQLKQIQSLRDQLHLQSDQVGYSSKYGDTLGKNDQLQQQLGSSLTKIVDIGKNFAMANLSQFESDIGISGNGAVEAVSNYGIQWGEQLLSGLTSGLFGGKGKGSGTTINVNNIDDALAAKRNLDNKDALQFTRRG